MVQDHPLELDRAKVGTERETRNVDERVLALFPSLGIGLDAGVGCNGRRRRGFLRGGHAAGLASFRAGRVRHGRGVPVELNVEVGEEAGGRVDGFALDFVLELRGVSGRGNV